MQVKNSTFIISGGASGLGAGSAKRLVGAGANVVLADLNEAVGTAFAAELGSQARFLRVDVVHSWDNAGTQMTGVRIGINTGMLGGGLKIIANSGEEM